MISTFGFGSWGLSKKSDKVTLEDIKLVKSAYKEGLMFFDTAPVYGNGYGENILSNLPKEALIATKIPGIRGANSFSNCYPENKAFESIENSIKRLSRIPYLIQFHNWDYKWVINDDFFNLCKNIKEKYNISKIGISLPKNQDANNIFEEPFLSKNEIEYFQVSWNIKFNDNTLLMQRLNSRNKKVIIRSIFDSGNLLKSPCNLENLYSTTIRETINLNPAIILVGLTKQKHLFDLSKTIEDVC